MSCYFQIILSLSSQINPSSESCIPPSPTLPGSFRYLLILSSSQYSRIIYFLFEFLAYSLRGVPWWLRWSRICLQCRRPGFNPWVRKIPWRREWLSTPVFLPGESHGQRSLAGYGSWGQDWATNTATTPYSLVLLTSIPGNLSTPVNDPSNILPLHSLAPFPPLILSSTLFPSQFTSN